MSKFSIEQIRETAARQQGKPVTVAEKKAANVSAMHFLASASKPVVMCAECNGVRTSAHEVFSPACFE